MPRGGYLQYCTSCSACSGVLIIGQITPYAPASMILPIHAESFHGTRESGTTLVVEIAASMFVADG